MIEACRECRSTWQDRPLHKCRVCPKHFCEAHAVSRSGIQFCSFGCGEFFFHPDDDDAQEDA